MKIAYTIEEVQNLTGIGKKCLRTLIHKRRIEASFIGRSYFIPHKEIIRLMEETKV
jgi:excisionase family DNA binding protein